MMKGFFASLMPRLLAILLLAGLPMGILLLDYVWQQHNQVILDKHQQARILVEGLTGAQDEFVLRTQRYLKRLAELPAVWAPEKPACNQLLRQIASINSDYLNLAIARPDGDVVCSARTVSGRVNVADREFMQRALTNRRFSIGSYQIDRVSKVASLGFAYPVIDPHRGRMSGIVIAMVSLETWSRMLGEQTLPAGAAAFIVDRHKTIVAHYPFNKRVIGLFAESYGYNTRPVKVHAGAVILQSQDSSGEEHAYAYKALRVLGDKPSLISGISLPLTSAVKLSRERLWQGGALVILGLSVLIGVVYLGLNNSIVEPLKRLLDYIVSLKQGADDEMPAVGGVSEVKALQAQIAAMAEARFTAESDLRDSEARLRLIAETIQEVFWVVTPDWKKVTYVNPAYEHIWQREPETLYRSPDSWLSAIVQEDRQRVLDYIAELQGSDCSNIVFPLYRIERRDGTVRWISTKGFPAYDADGKLTSVVGIAEDVTERKQYEAELSEREAKYRMLVEHAEDLVVKIDTDGHFLFVSPSYCRTLGKSEYQLMGKPFMPLVHEDDQAATGEAMKRLYYPPFSAYLEHRAMTIEGLHWFGWSFTSVLDEQQNVTEIIGVGRDITQQKQTELALRESEVRNRELIDNMSDGVAVFQRIGDSDDFRIGNFNHAAERMAGYTKEQVIGQRVDILFPGVEELGLLDTIRQVASDGKPVHSPVSSYHDERLQLWLEYYVFELPSGEVVAVFRDATAEQQANEALRNSEETFRGFFEDLSLGLVIADRHGVTQEVNRAFAQMFGIERERTIGAPLQELLAIESQPEIADGLSQLVNGGQERYRFQASYSLAGEQTLTVNIAIGILRDERRQRASLYVIAEDVTALEMAREERNNLQQELMRSYRLEALGRLAGGIAHDFNNVLGAISGFVELAASRIGSVDSQQIRTYLEKSLESSERAKQLINQLLIFSRGPEYQAARPQEFGKVVSNAMELVHSILPSSITFEMELANEPLRVVCDAVLIEQALLNLCVNARDAMDGKGSIKVTLDSYQANGERCLICSDSVEGEWVSLRVEDSGQGISDRDMEHIFEPFFTTKGRESGTGLGLSVVHGIVSGFNGHILIDSESGQGTSFRILFPHYEDDAESPQDPEVEQASLELVSLRPGLRVLVVDDEAAIRQLLQEALLAEGYDVEVCNNGQQAWERLLDRQSGFDLLITDQTMPHMTGLELVGRLRAEGNRLPVVLCTGFSESVNEHVLQELNIDQSLQKPVRLDQLKSTLRALLLARGPGQDRPLFVGSAKH